MEEYCSTCRRRELFIRKPVYNGFTRVGEELVCSACGARKPVKPASGTAGPASAPAPRKLSIFGDDDLPKPVKLFDEDEGRRTCRHCVHYLVNPFTQRCALHDKNIEATDTCPDFEAREG